MSRWCGRVALLRPRWQVCGSGAAAGGCHSASCVGCSCLRRLPPNHRPLGGEVAQEQCLYIPAVLISFVTHTLRGRVTGNRLALARGHTAVGLFKKCFCKGDGHQEAVCPWPSLLTSWALCVMWVGGALGCCLRQCGRRVKGADGRARPPVSSPGSSTWKLGGFG